jgi:phenylacetate-coenzyme A ligase PaaK-like adenylate-forming protein
MFKKTTRPSQPPNPTPNAIALVEIVLTSLTNYAMPLIRYKIGDYSHFVEKGGATASSFSGHRTHQRLKAETDGR